MDKPKTVAILPGEGAKWERFVPWQHETDAGRQKHPSKVHAIMFDDRSVWDAVNGWRRQWDRPLPPGIEESAVATIDGTDWAEVVFEPPVQAALRNG